ncbi:hypothetical protein CONCODRAFT_6317 [Conidiobolus coronatus NRRL 28638]|uniref:Cytochrome P450 n=1 Tax=Conidiobolus coronatus (strain ATCC 28846 / CBS 209.66 / NRRL 28638) TaxID=796925 RepID=A0A137P7M9_CONC2|nr:hypothetical protein CONCODRAFT_6317 [Conidiobolus coronatus NRRL 28638]|eukprot:KXN71010.1 hypothetical protein CONCODRAFT_6317 [Conidiobolus coronatus NRRL 28638]
MPKAMNSAFNKTWKPELFEECFNQAVEEWYKLEGKKFSFMIKFKAPEYNIFADSLIKRRKADKDSLFTKFVQASISSNSQEAAVSTRELRLENMFVTGQKTTANIIIATIYYLSRYPEIQENCILK